MCLGRGRACIRRRPVPCLDFTGRPKSKLPTDLCRGWPSEVLGLGVLQICVWWYRHSFTRIASLIRVPPSLLIDRCRLRLMLAPRYLFFLQSRSGFLWVRYRPSFCTICLSPMICAFHQNEKMTGKQGKQGKASFSRGRFGCSGWPSRILTCISSRVSMSRH